MEYYRKWHVIVKGVFGRSSILRLHGLPEKVCDTGWHDSRTYAIVMLDNAHFRKRIWQKRFLWSCKLEQVFKHCPCYTITDNTNFTTLWQDVFVINPKNGQCPEHESLLYRSSSFESLRVVSGFCNIPLFMTDSHFIVINITG